MKFIKKLAEKKEKNKDDKNIVSAKPFYFAVAVCLIGAGIAAWIAVDYNIGTPIQNSQSSSVSVAVSSSIPSEQSDNLQSSNIDANSDNNDNDSSNTEQSQSVSSSQVLQQDAEDNEQNQNAHAEQDNVPAVTQPTPQIEQTQSTTLLFAMPIQGEIFNEFSNGELVKSITMGDWRTHDGIDIAGEIAQPVKSAAEGVVKSIEQDAMWGTVIEIEHAGGYTTVYCGLNEQTHVTVGEQVEIHQTIASIGDSALEEILEPVHLHFGMKKDGEWIDPLSVIKHL